jgi:hypothetical protein
MISNAVLKVSIPVGTVGLTVRFADGTRTPRFDQSLGKVLLGNQTVGATSR